MAHLVTCAKCGVRYDRDKIKTTKYNGRRYCHYTCFPEGEIVEAETATLSQEELDRKALCDYIVEKHGLKATGPAINKQIKEYHDNAGYTYSGMLKALQYWYDIKHNYDPKFKGTIAIIGKIYNQAYDYYLNLYKAQLVNQGKNVKDYEARVKEILMPSPRPQERKKRLFDMEDED